MIYLVIAEVVLALVVWKLVRNSPSGLRAADGIILGLFLSSIIWIGGVILWKFLN
jgi:hypothetical protein